MCTPRGTSRSPVEFSTRGLGIAFTLLCLCLCPPFAALAGEARKADAPKPSEPADETWLREAERELDKLFVVPEEIMAVALEKALFDAKAMLRHAEEVARKGPESSRPRAAALAGKVQRLAMGDPSAALRAVAPVLIGEVKAKAWDAALAENLKGAVAKWEEDTRQLKTQGSREKDLPKKPEMCDVFAPFPPVAEWDMSGPKARCAIEAGYAFLALGRQQDALGVFRHIGEKNRENLAEVLSSEGGGDLHCQPGQYEKCVGFLEYALKTARHLVSYLNDDPFGEARHAQNRIERKLAAAKRLWDIERYGEGFVDYRAAETLRRKDRRFLDAFLAYAALQEKYPKTVYEAAGQSYQCKCMLALADPAEEKKAREAIAKAEKAYEADAKLLADMQKDHKELAKNKKLIDGLREFLDAEQADLAAMKAVPMGKAASLAAQKQVEAMLKENEWGLYRGEVLLDLGRTCLDRDADLKKSRQWYERLYGWLRGVRAFQGDMAAYRVPEQAAVPARAPEAEKKAAGWNGYLTKAAIPIGAVVNRLSCHWYLDSLHAECARMLSLFAFLAGDRARAETLLADAMQHDPVEGGLFASGSPNSYSRLRSAYQKGWFCQPEAHARFFKGNQRDLLLLGDFYYEIEDEDRCLLVRQRLVDGAYGALTVPQKASAEYRLACILFRMMRFDEARTVLTRTIADCPGTEGQAWCYIGMGNLSLQMTDKREQAKASGYYEKALEAKLLPHEKERTLYYLGRAYQVAELPKRALETFQQLIEQYPTGAYGALCRKYIMELTRAEGE